MTEYKESQIYLKGKNKTDDIDKIEKSDDGHKYYVTFKNGNVYLYSNVDNATYEDVRNSESIGKALHKEVFGVFKYQKLNNKVSVKYPERLIKRKNPIT